MQFHRLTTIRKTGKKYSNGCWQWLCSCACGNTTLIGSSHLKRTLSCGCVRDERKVAAVTKHGQCLSRTYMTWSAMRDRCNRIASPAYKYYGGRGITICNSWFQFTNFLKDMGERPEGLTLDRIDNNGDYNPENCRWASYKQQAHNRSNSIKITIDGTSKLVIEWARELGIKVSVVQGRLRRGWTPIDALTKEVY